MGAEHQIEALNLNLPTAPKPGGVYQPVLILGNLAYVSGHGPLLNDESYITGKAGAELNAEAAKAAARQTGLAILASLRTNVTPLPG